MTLKLLLIGLVFTVSGCPHNGQQAVVKSQATVKSSELPSDVAALNFYADAQYRMQTPASLDNGLLAVEKAMTISPGYESAWRGARICVWFTEEYTADQDKKKVFAERGIAFGEQAVKFEPNKVEGHYYYAANIGQYAVDRKLQARDMIPKLLAAAKRAVQIDEKYDSAGPVRLLGSLYALAPEPPASIGDHEEGIRYLQRAVALFDGYPQNHLLLGDAYVVVRDLNQAEREFQRVLITPSRADMARMHERWRSLAEAGLRKVGVLRRQSGNSSPF